MVYLEVFKSLTSVQVDPFQTSVLPVYGGSIPAKPIAAVDVPTRAPPFLV